MSLQVGDFFAIATATGRVIRALSAATGSKAEFTSLLRVLKGLQHAVLQAEAVALEATTTPNDVKIDPVRQQLREDLADQLIAERDALQTSLDKFHKDFGCYVRAFEGKTAKNVAIATARKLTYVFASGDVVNFERRLGEHLQTLQLRLAAFYYTMLKDRADGLHGQLEGVNGSMSALIQGVDGMSLRLTETCLKLDALTNYLPASMGYIWVSEQPVLLHDALGRKMGLPMMLVSTPEIFRDVLLILHRERPGYDKIENGKYIVSNEDAEGALVPHDQWNNTVKPGRHLALSFVLKHPGSLDNQCPRCHATHTRSTSRPGRVECLICNLDFQVEDRQRMQFYFKDRRIRPKAPKAKSTTAVPRVTTSEAGDDKPRSKSVSLPPEQYRHPYSRVHYQRDVLRGASFTRGWGDGDPEFQAMLLALPPLHRAAARGDIDAMDELLTSDESPDVDWSAYDSDYRCDRTGWDFTGAPPIHFAAYFKHDRAVRFLLRCKANIDGTDAAGTTALHAAAWTGNIELFNTLIKHGANPEARDLDGWNAAIYALNQGHEHMVRTILENTPGDTEMMHRAYTARHVAKLGGDLSILPKNEDVEGLANPIHARQLILDEALVGAADGGHAELVRELLQRGANPTALDSTGSTALHWCCWGAHSDVQCQHFEHARTLESAQAAGAGADITQNNNFHSNASNGPAGNNGSEAAGDSDTDSLAKRLMFRAHRHEAVIQALVAHGAHIDAPNAQGTTGLHWVAGAGCAPMVAFLVSMGACMSAPDADGRSALDRADDTGDHVLAAFMRGLHSKKAMSNEQDALSAAGADPGGLTAVKTTYLRPPSTARL